MDGYMESCEEIYYDLDTEIMESIRKEEDKQCNLNDGIYTKMNTGV